MGKQRDERAIEKKRREIFKIYVDIRRAKKENPGISDMEEKGVTRATVEYYWRSLINLEKEAIKQFPKLYDKGHRVGQRKNRKQEILEAFVDIRRRTRADLSQRDIQNANDPRISVDTVNSYYGGITELTKIARQQYPDAFHDIAMEELLTKGHSKKIQEWIDGYKRFFITTAVMGCDVDENLLKSILKYCQDNNARLLVLACADPAKRQATWSDLGHIDKRLAKYVVTEDSMLNSNLFISTIKLSAKHIDPITGLGRIGQREGSFIYASPKQRLKGFAVSNMKLPHLLMTTGAITVPDYNTQMYMSERTAYIATHDHQMGGVIVEVEDNNVFHVRHVQADEKGRFIDLGQEWSEKGKKPVRPAAFVLGDWHSGVTDPGAKNCWKEISNQLKPEYLVMHDIFDGLSINHHEKHNHILRAQRAQQGDLDLLSELVGLRDDLEELTTWADQVVVVKSNHDEFLTRYLQEGLYVKDAQNHKVALKLADKMLDGEDPLKWAVEDMIGLSAKDKVRWLTRDEDFFVAKIQLGSHGDKGANGAKGNLNAMEQAYGNSVTGHTHSPEILRGAWQVGTSSLLKLDYNKGPSSWLHASCLVYPNGARQLIMAIDGKWKL